MRNILLFFMILALQVTEAQDYDSNPYFQFTEGDTVHLFSENVNIYEYPDFESAVICKYKAGNKLILKDKEEIIAVKNGLSVPFYELSPQPGQSFKKGFIWSGDIAMKSENFSKDQNLIFLFGISKIEKSKEKNKADELYLSCKILSNDKLLANKEFKALGDLSFYRYLNVYDNKGVRGIKNILNFELRNYYNAGDYGTQVLFWDGKKISVVRDMKNTDDPPCYYTENLIYPNDDEGVKDYILIKSLNGCNEGDQKIEEKTGQYSWKKNKLKLLLETKTTYK
jgi:hypothetical protein